MIEQEDPAIKKASSVLNYLANDKETMRLYELREKAIHDEVTRIEGAREEGMKQVALSLLSQNVSIEVIMNSTGLKKEEIEVLKESGL